MIIEGVNYLITDNLEKENEEYLIEFFNEKLVNIILKTELNKVS